MPLAVPWQKGDDGAFDDALGHIPIDKFPALHAMWFTPAKEQGAVMASFDLTDIEWSVIRPLLPTKVRGQPRFGD